MTNYSFCQAPREEKMKCLFEVVPFQDHPIPGVIVTSGRVSCRGGPRFGIGFQGEQQKTFTKFWGDPMHAHTYTHAIISQKELAYLAALGRGG